MIAHGTAPAMDAGAHNWLVGFARKNLWRLREPGYELQDLVQEGFLCYQKVLARYPHAKDRAHIMALFKTAYRNHVLDLARHSRHYHAAFPGTDIDKVLAITCGHAELCQVIADLPTDVTLIKATLKSQTSVPSQTLPKLPICRAKQNTANSRSCPMASAIEAELSKATKIKQGKGESRPEFLTRVWNGVYDLSDKAWDGLSSASAGWANEVTLAHKEWRKSEPNGEFIPDDFPDAVKAKAVKDTDTDEDTDEDEEEAPKSKPKSKLKAVPKPEPEEDEEEAAPEAVAEAKPEPEPEPAPAKAVKAPKKPEPKPEPKAKAKPPAEDEPHLNIQGTVRVMMIDNPGLELNDMHRQIEEKYGATVSLTTVRASHSWFRAALRDLLRKNCLTKEFRDKLSRMGQGSPSERG